MTEPKENKPKNTLVLSKELRGLENRVEKLERLIARMAHQTGTQNILRAFNVEPFEPGKEDMGKWKD